MNLSSVVLTGLESAGKSALFRGLTGQAAGDEANFRGSTVVCRKCRARDCDCEVVDTPGIRLEKDAETTRKALQAMHEADVVLLVARGTHAVTEVETLLRELDLQQKKTALAITFGDKAPAGIEAVARAYETRLGIPVVVINARSLDAEGRRSVLHAIAHAQTTRSADADGQDLLLPAVQPCSTWFENRRLGPWLALACMAVMFAGPVYAAYGFAAWLQPLADSGLVEPLKASAAWMPETARALLVGNYGILTLGWYSLLWALPVVLLMSLSVALAEEAGLKDRITAALDPWLRWIGLSGRDLIPALTGFGCNVVAVFQSRACSDCTRRNCISMISFGSACSYQIGASLSIFGSAGQPGLFLPYMAGLLVVGAVHTRLWHGRLPQGHDQPLHERAFLQWPSARATAWRVKTAVKQFLWQAMPVFLLICGVAAWLEHLGIMARLAAWTGPLLHLFHLPGEVAPGILFSILRKDGLLTLNRGDGTFLTALSPGQVLTLVWLATTFTACLVTLWTIRRELGWKYALQSAGRQSVTSLVSAGLLAWIFS